jgi:hypothetical protein
MHVGPLPPLLLLLPLHQLLTGQLADPVLHLSADEDT